MSKAKRKLEAKITACDKLIKNLDTELEKIRDKNKSEPLSTEDKKKQTDLLRTKLYMLSEKNKAGEKLNAPSFFNKKNAERAAMIFSPLICLGIYGINRAKKAHKMNKEHKESYKSFRNTI